MSAEADLLAPIGFHLQEHSSDHALWMLDYDGTLTPIVDRPEEAQISAERLQVLKQLAHRPHTTVAIVSGRSVEQLRHFFRTMAGEPLLLSGLHGGQVFDLATDTFQVSPEEGFREAIDRLQEALEAQVVSAQWDGVLLENKTFSLALHTRLATDTVEASSQEFLKQHVETTPELCGAFRIQYGKRVMEVVPSAFHKSRAVEYLYDQGRAQIKSASIPNPAVFPLYMGDDQTDEVAFEAVNARQGCSIRVGPSEMKTCAHHRLPSVEAVYELLERQPQSVMRG